MKELIMFYTDPEFELVEDLVEWLQAGKLVFVFSLEKGVIPLGPGVCHIYGPRPPKQRGWVARVIYNENNEIKRITHILDLKVTHHEGYSDSGVWP